MKFFKGVIMSFITGFADKVYDEFCKSDFKSIVIGPFTLLYSLIEVFRAKDKARELYVQGWSITGGFIFSIISDFILRDNPGIFMGITSLFLGALFSTFCGEKAGKHYDLKNSRSQSECEKKGAGLDKEDRPGGENQGGPGGVEIRKVKPFLNISEPVNYLTKTVNVFFESSANEEDIIYAFNSLVLPAFRKKTISEYFETILQEVSDSLDMNHDLPFVSLHFNKNKLLYSVMPSFYRTTLIGNVFAFMDYFLKGFVNGGFFSIDFVRDWVSKPPNQRITNLDILNKNLIHVKKLLSKTGKNSQYYSINELIDQEKTSDDFDSAFRIIGQMKQIGKVDDVLFPYGGFTVEHDLNPKPEKQLELDSKNEGALSNYSEISFKYHQMRTIIHEVMPEVPEFRGLFPILDMITFAYHYIISLRSVGKTVECKKAFHYTNKNVSYIEKIPEVFPPLPVPNRKEIQVNYKFSEALKDLKGTCFRDEVEKILYGNQQNFSKKGLIEILEKFDQFILEKILYAIGDLYLYDDEKLCMIKDFRENFLNIIKDIPDKIMKNLYKCFCESQNILKKENPHNKRFTQMNFGELKSLHYQNLNEINAKMVYTQANVDKIHKELARFRIEGNIIYDNPVQILDYESTITFTFHLVRPTISEQERRKIIIGGCLVNLSNDANILIDFKSENEMNEIHSNLNKNKSYIKCKSGLSGFLLKLNIVPFSIDGSNLILSKFQNLFKNDIQVDKNILSNLSFKSILQKMIKLQKQNELLNKETQAYYACCCGDAYTIKLLIDNGADFGKSLENGIYPFLAAIMNGHHDEVKLLLTSKAKIGDVNRATETEVTPLYWAIYYDFPDIVDLLLKRGAYINIPLKSNGMSAVHLACHHDRPECLSLLLKSSSRNTFKNTTFWIFHDTNYIDPFGMSTGGLTPLQIALNHSPRCAYLLINQKKGNISSIFSSFGFVLRDIAIINGQYQMTRLISKTKGKMEDILIKNSNVNEKNDFDELCNAFSSGDLSIAERSFANWFERFGKIKLNQNQVKKLVEYACIGSCSNYVQILSKVIKLNEFPIALRAAHYGLVDWIPKIEKFGGQLMCEIDHHTIFDIAVENSDQELLEAAFKNIDDVPEQIIQRIVKKSIEINNAEVMHSISKALSNEKSRRFLNPKDIFIPSASINAFLIFKNDIDPKVPIELKNHILSISSNLLSYLFTVYYFTKNDLKAAYRKANNNQRNDNAYTILDKNRFLLNEIDGALDKLSLREDAIESIQVLIDDILYPEDSKIEQVKNLFSDIFDFGDLNFDNLCPLALLAGKSINHLWLLKTLPQRCLDEFIIWRRAIKEKNIELLFKKELKILESILSIEKVGYYFLNSIRKLDFSDIEKDGLGNEFISSLLNTIAQQNLFACDKDNQTIFHYISKIKSISNDNMNKITNIMKSISKNLLEELINARTRTGETVMMSFASSGNWDAIEYISKMDVSLYSRDIYGDNLLHKILKSTNSNNNDIILSISLITKKSPELIIQKNRKEINPFMIAAEKGFNGILGLMSTYYPIKILDSSSKYSIIHIAAKFNQPQTVRYIVQNLHIDVNLKTQKGCTPLHFAAQMSSTHAYKELILLGGNPLIMDNNKMTAIDYALKFGNEKIIRNIMKSPSFNIELLSSEIITYLAYNKSAYPAFVHIMTLFDKSAIHICDSVGMSVVSLACIENNRKCAADALIYGCDPEKKDVLGRNSIHICALRNSIGCSDLILNHLNQKKGYKKVQDILNSTESNGDTPIHIAAKNGLDGFVCHLLCACKDQNLLKENNSGRTPFAESIKNGNKKVAGILAHFWTNILNQSIDTIVNKLSPELQKKWREEFLESDDYYSGNEIVDLFKDNMMKPINEHDIINEEEEEELENKISRIDIFMNTLKNEKIIIPDQFMIKCSNLINNISFRVVINIILNEKKTVPLVNKIIESATNMKSNKLRNIAYLIILPIIQITDINNFVDLINAFDQIKIQESHPLFSWIENGLVSVAETTKDNAKINSNIKSVFDIVSFIIENKDLKNTIAYPVFPVTIHEASDYILKIKDEKYRKIQLRFAHKMNILMLYEKEKKFSIDICNRISKDQNVLIDYLIKHDEDIGQDVLERSIQLTIDLYNDPSLNDSVRETILNECTYMLSKDNNPNLMKNLIGAWVSGSVKIIQNYGLNYFNQILPIIESYSFNIACESISAILTINSPKIATIQLVKKGIDSLKICAEKEERKRFVETRNLTDIIRAFNEGSTRFIPYKYAFDGTPIFKLQKNELQSLMKFGELLEKQPKIVNIKDVALEQGKKFRDHPNIENAAKLVSIVRQAIRETFDLNPFIIQCLTVASMLLHRINKSKRIDLKGRIAQVATGEGKSIIVAMLAGCIGLTGSCVDIISSSIYLAIRDAEKFKPFYEKLGLQCGIVSENEKTDSYDYHILYSTNTGFEFAFLREGISGKEIITTTLLYKNIKQQRPRMTAIVDEADNLFIDTASNSARIAQSGNSKRSWIFKPIWQCAIQFMMDMYVPSIDQNGLDLSAFRNALVENATNEERIETLNEITEIQLIQYIKNAFKAMKLFKDVDYVVGKNKDTDELEIQIVDADNTGRVQYGMHWSNGLHEFVELKEGLTIHNQNYTVASISHPSFFEPYDEIFGLTGTLGEESEREEIFDIYKVDSFDVPPNRKCQRKRDKTLIFQTEKKKEEYIINTILRLKNEGRPILIIVYSIEESERLSSLLRNKKIDHFVLNDQQSEDEDFVVDHAGLPGAVTVATNTAGRGTDIRIDKVALNNGGLHTLITFWPANLRVECQALGRSARQGQPGSCQIIFTSKEFGNDLHEPTEKTLKAVYEKRTRKIEIGSNLRKNQFFQEKEIFEILKQYFEYIRKLSNFLILPESESILKLKYEGKNVDFIINELSQCWAEFYTSISDYQNVGKTFEDFLKKWKFESKFPELSEKFNEWISNEPEIEQYSPLPSATNSIEITSQSEENIEKMNSIGIGKDLYEDALSAADNNISIAADLLFNGSMRGSRRKENKNNEEEATGNLGKLISMGFDRESSEKALKQTNDNLQIAVTLLNNQEKEDSRETNLDENENPEIKEKIETLMMMGFDEKSCKIALKQSNYNLQEAAEILADRSEKMETETESQSHQLKKSEIDRLVDYFVSMGFDKRKSRQALFEANNNIDNALDILNNNNQNENEEKNEIKEDYEMKNDDIIIKESEKLSNIKEEIIIEQKSIEKPHKTIKSISICDLFILFALSILILGAFCIFFYLIR